MKSPVTRLREWFHRNWPYLFSVWLIFTAGAFVADVTHPGRKPPKPTPKPKTITKIITTTPTISKRTVETEEFLPGRVMPKTRRKVTFEYGEAK